METYANKFKERLKAGEQLSACWAQLASTLSAEILAQAGFDIIVVDCEHAPVDPTNLYPILQAINGYDCMPMVRAPWNDLVEIKRLCDCGAQGVHIPYVSTKEEALDAVRACKYPPFGTRGIAGSPRAVGFTKNRGQYLQHANEAMLTMVAIETKTGVENVEAMCEIEELDGIFIGPMDLATNLGYFASPADEHVQEVIREVEKKVLAKKKLLATIAGSAEAAKKLYDRGYSYVIFASDGGNLANSAYSEVEAFRNYMNR